MICGSKREIDPAAYMVHTSYSGLGNFCSGRLLDRSRRGLELLLFGFWNRQVRQHVLHHHAETCFFTSVFAFENFGEKKIQQKFNRLILFGTGLQRWRSSRSSKKFQTAKARREECTKTRQTSERANDHKRVIELRTLISFTSLSLLLSPVYPRSFNPLVFLTSIFARYRSSTAYRRSSWTPYFCQLTYLVG